MKRNSTLWLFIIIVMLFFLNSCSKSKNNDEENEEFPAVAIGSSKNKPGLGETPGIPEGTTWQLPDCIKIVDRPGYRFDPDETAVYGLTQTFYVPVHLVNTCDNSVSLEVPGGLILNSQFRDGQNGLLVERILIDVPPTGNIGGVKDTTTIYLAVSCLNETKTPPISFYDAQYNIGDIDYTIGKITNDPNLLQFIKLLENRTSLRVNGFETNLPPEPGEQTPLQKMYSEIQMALWEITNGDGLNEDEVKSLIKMLDKFK